MRKWQHVRVEAAGRAAGPGREQATAARLRGAARLIEGRPRSVAHLIAAFQTVAKVAFAISPSAVRQIAPRGPGLHGTVLPAVPVLAAAFRDAPALALIWAARSITHNWEPVPDRQKGTTNRTQTQVSKARGRQFDRHNLQKPTEALAGSTGRHQEFVATASERLRDGAARKTARQT